MRWIFFLIGVLMVCAVAAPAYPQLLLYDDFDYPPGDSLRAHGWKLNQTTTTNPILVVEPGLAYSGYQGSAVGGAARVGPTGQDLYREFTPDSAGTLYSSFVVNVSQAQAGDYFLHLHTTPVSSGFIARVFVRAANNGNLAFGIAKRGTNAAPTVKYSDSLYARDATYLLALKYEFREGGGVNDRVSLFVFESGELPPEEPMIPAVGPLEDATSDASVIGAIGLRQGEQAKGATLTVDGIRVTRNWQVGFPVTLVTLDAVDDQPSLGTRLLWETASEQAGTRFEVERSSDPAGGFAVMEGSSQSGRGSAGAYSYLDVSPLPGVSYYRLRITSNEGAISVSHPVKRDVPSAVAFADASVATFVRSYPNPFNGETVITLQLAVRDHVDLRVYDILGREVAVLVNERKEPGRYSIRFPLDDVSGSGRSSPRLSSGPYICSLRTGSMSQNWLMMMLK